MDMFNVVSMFAGELMVVFAMAVSSIALNYALAAFQLAPSSVTGTRLLAWIFFIAASLLRAAGTAYNLLYDWGWNAALCSAWQNAGLCRGAWLTEIDLLFIAIGMMLSFHSYVFTMQVHGEVFAPCKRAPLLLLATTPIIVPFVMFSSSNLTNSALLASLSTLVPLLVYSVYAVVDTLLALAVLAVVHIHMRQLSTPGITPQASYDALGLSTPTSLLPPSPNTSPDPPSTRALLFKDQAGDRPLVLQLAIQKAIWFALVVNALHCATHILCYIIHDSTPDNNSLASTSLWADFHLFTITLTRFGTLLPQLMLYELLQCKNSCYSNNYTALADSQIHSQPSTPS